MLINTKNKWWQSTVFYEIYIASFQDGNGDGIGDFKGLTSRLDYLQRLGVNGLWITPFYPSPKVDNGYDVSDYFDIDPDFGSLADFDYFMAEAHKRNIKVIIDVVLNHVSTEHIWFKEAISSPDNKYREYFFFQNEINNWTSFFGGSAWEREPGGEQYYYHKFAPQQVDLNWQNQAVKNEMTAMLKFWLDRGVDGFRFDVINFLSCSGIGDENPVDSNGLQIHLNDIDQQGIYSCISEMCDVVRKYGSSIGKDCFLIGEVGHEELLKLQAYQRENLLDVVFNFNLGSISKFDISYVYKQLQDMENQLNGLPTIFFNSHDMARSMSRLCNNDTEQAAALATLTLTLKGICFLYFGEEIGMPNFEAQNVCDLRDVRSTSHFQLALDKGETELQAFEKATEECRDKSRLYMQWNTGKYSGFSRALPWIGNSDLENLPNVELQVNDPDSLWHWYRKLIALRREFKVLNSGSYETLSLNDKLLFISRRWDREIIHIFINFNDVAKRVNYKLSHDILASRGFNLNRPDWLLPFGVLITREI